MINQFSSEENKKAMTYTTIICGVLLLLFIFIRWTDFPPSTMIIQDQIEINLGNNDEGFGEEQPLVKGSPSLESDKTKNTAAPEDPSTNEKINPADNAEADAAPIVKTNNNKAKIQPEKPKVELPAKTATAPQKPKITYQGPTKDINGNNKDEDNTFKSQGKNPTKNADDGVPDGKKNGAATGGPKVTKGNRKIVKHYKFEGELSKATIYAIISVSPTGQGKFIGFDKGTTNRSQAYANAVSSYLSNIQFDNSDEASTVTVQFIFDVN